MLMSMTHAQGLMRSPLKSPKCPSWTSARGRFADKNVPAGGSAQMPWPGRAPRWCPCLCIPPQVMVKALRQNLFLVPSDWEPHWKIWELETIDCSKEESLLLCRSRLTWNRCDSCSCSDEIIASWIVCICLCYLLHTERNKQVEIIQVKLRHLKIRKCQELRCSWSSVSLLLFIHYGRVLNYIITFLFLPREPMPHSARGDRLVLFNASLYHQLLLCTSLPCVQH